MEQQQWPEVINNDHFLWVPIDPTNADQSCYVYVPITKCASTYLGNLLPAPKFSSRLWQTNDAIQLPDRGNTWWFVVLRDPWERWVSGATHWLTHCKEWQEKIEHVIDIMEMDVHTCPQAQFLTDTDPDRTVYMAYRTDIGTHPWFHNKGWRLHTVPQERYNTTERTDIRDQLLSRLDQQKISRIREYYQEDYELIRTARFI
jgi:hypothetical protein